MAERGLIPMERIERMIFVLRGQRIMLDADLAAMYGVETKALNRAVKRNGARFPSDFVFQLTEQEIADLRFHSGTSNDDDAASRSQSGTSKGRGGRRYPPYAFTQEGVAMLSSAPAVHPAHSVHSVHSVLRPEMDGVGSVDSMDGRACDALLESGPRHVDEVEEPQSAEGGVSLPPTAPASRRR
jgi:hypothetical protein